MSYTSSTAKAVFTVAEDFNLDSYLKGLSKQCAETENFIEKAYGLDPVDETLVDLNFNDYVTKNDSEVIVMMETEGAAYDHDVFKWILARVVPIMTSDYMRVEYITMDSRDGNSCSIEYHTKGGAILGTDNLIDFYLV